ncbi:hypothetical protein B296_00027074 [Ensete ventricosum]|uniref:Uncharacterized protein n=1 Tax=Ensete ventricosum TaxID=4639 RepID=A0A426Z1X5_ENSVE|nr:hypothetical protein B296_00027074 [Ensete ventricosum]
MPRLPPRSPPSPLPRLRQRPPLRLLPLPVLLVLFLFALLRRAPRIRGRRRGGGARVDSRG